MTSIAANIGGDLVDVQGIVPEGTNSHTFEPAPSVAGLLSDADLLTVEAPPGSMPGVGSPARLALGVAIAFVLAVALVWVLYQLTV